MAIAAGTTGDKPAIVPTKDIIVIVNIAIASKSVAVTFMARLKNRNNLRQTRSLSPLSVLSYGFLIKEVLGFDFL